MKNHIAAARTRRMAAWAFLGVALMCSACGASAEGNSVEAPEPTEVETSAPASSPDAAPEPTLPPEPSSVAFSETSDVPYMTIDGVPLMMDVFVPVGGGPSPVVVSFHGLGNEAKDMAETTAVAEAAAAAGLLVFTPTWIAGSPFPITSDTFETWDNTVSCAIGFAQQIAPEIGGDPTTTVVDGFSAGAGAALLFASQDPRVEPIPGCQTDELPTQAAGFVMGDVESWLYSPNFDDAFTSEPEAIQTRLAALIGPNAWEYGADATFQLWASENGLPPRGIGDLSDGSGWFARRDPDGFIRADLERIDQLSDGEVDQIDASQLLELRLTEAGIEAALDVYPGGHTTLDKVADIVGYLLVAAGL